eukprot:scaffold82108_cov60-Phaeocystis_antarctica.AAC.2
METCATGAQGALESIRTPTPAGWRAKVAPQDYGLVVKALETSLKAETETVPCYLLPKTNFL